MLRLATLVSLFAVPTVGAQTFVRAHPADLGAVVQVEPPAAFQLLGSLDSFGQVEAYALAVRDGKGDLTVIDHEMPRQPGQSTDVSGGWQQVTVGCGTACFYTWYLEPALGRVSPPLFAPIYEDPARGWALVPAETGVQIVDPFDPSWAWALAIPPDAPLAGAVMGLYVDVQVSPDGVLTLSAEGVPGTIRAQLPVRE